MSHPVPEFAIPCFQCGYDLRGLEPVDELIRCPECGQVRSWKSVESCCAEAAAAAAAKAEAAARRRWKARVTRAETGANLCAIAVGATVVAAALRLVFREFYSGISAPMFVTSVIIWASGVAVHARSCREFSGRWRAFVRHQSLAIPAVLLNIVGILGMLALVWAVLADIDGPPCCFLVVVMAAPFAAWVLRPFRFFSKRARAAIEDMLRAAAKPTE